MRPRDTFDERVVACARPERHHAMALAPDGRFLAADDSGTLAVTDMVADAAMWHLDGATLRHYRGTVELQVDPDGPPCHGSDRHGAECRLHRDGRPIRVDGIADDAPLRIVHGPERLPSEYLDHLRTHGWVCLAAVLAADTVDDLQRIAGTDGHSHRRPDRATRQICQGGALARTAAEPVSVWLARRYMRTDDIRLAHSPHIGVMTPDDGERTVQGWHSDYPYHWGIRAAGRVPTPSGATVMGVQRIVCVSEFTKHRGATAFKLGSHDLERGPPAAWGIAADAYQPGYRAANGLPYNGPDADVIEAPAGSMILFDTRTWHRAGINRSAQGRAAILMDMTPAYIVPYSDTSEDYRALIDSDAYGELNERERAELQRLMVHRFLGPAGPRSVIGTNAELTERFPARRR